MKKAILRILAAVLCCVLLASPAAGRAMNVTNVKNDAGIVGYWRTGGGDRAEMVITDDGALQMKAMFLRVFEYDEMLVRQTDDLYTFTRPDLTVTGTLTRQPDGSLVLRAQEGPAWEGEYDAAEYMIGREFVFRRAELSEMWYEEPWETWDADGTDEDWLGHWAMDEQGRSSHLYITRNTVGQMEWRVTFDNGYSFSGILERQTGREMYFDCSSINGTLELSRKLKIIQMEDVGCMVEAVSDWLDLFSYSPEYYLVEAYGTPGDVPQTGIGGIGTEEEAPSSAGPTLPPQPGEVVLVTPVPQTGVSGIGGESSGSQTPGTSGIGGIGSGGEVPGTVGIGGRSSGSQTPGTSGIGGISSEEEGSGASGIGGIGTGSTGSAGSGLVPIPGRSDCLQVPVRSVNATSYIIGKDPEAYVPWRMIDGDETTAFQFSLKESALGEGCVYFDFDGTAPMDTLWIKNGFWKVTDGKDQYTRNCRVKTMTIDFLYAGSGGYRDPMTVDLPDDKKRTDWIVVPLGDRHRVLSVRIRVDDVYRGSKYKYDVCISEVMFVRTAGR